MHGTRHPETDNDAMTYKMFVMREKEETISGFVKTLGISVSL